MTFDTQNKCSMTARMFAAGFQRKIIWFHCPLLQRLCRRTRSQLHLKSRHDLGVGGTYDLGTRIANNHGTDIADSLVECFWLASCHPERSEGPLASMRRH